MPHLPKKHRNAGVAAPGRKMRAAAMRVLLIMLWLALVFGFTAMTAGPRAHFAGCLPGRLFLSPASAARLVPESLKPGRESPEPWASPTPFLLTTGFVLTQLLVLFPGRGAWRHLALRRPPSWIYSFTAALVLTLLLTHVLTPLVTAPAGIAGVGTRGFTRPAEAALLGGLYLGFRAWRRYQSDYERARALGALILGLSVFLCTLWLGLQTFGVLSVRPETAVESAFWTLSGAFWAAALHCGLGFLHPLHKRQEACLFTLGGWISRPPLDIPSQGVTAGVPDAGSLPRRSGASPHLFQDEGRHLTN